MNLSELRNYRANLADDVERTCLIAKKLGVTEGTQRLALVGKYFKKLSIESAYSMLDPEGLQQEVEKAQEHKYKIGMWRVVRNCFSLFPLILTWFALYLATSHYQQDLADPKYKDVDQYQPFLRLWQEGFHGTTWFTFSTAAFIDCVLLLAYLGLIVLVAVLERRTSKASSSFALQLQSVSEDLLDTIAQVGPSAGTSDVGIDRIVQTIERVADAGTDKLLQAVKSVSDADVDKIVQAIKQVLDDTLMSSDQVAQKAQEFIEISNQKMDDMFNGKVKMMLDQFHSDLGTFNTDLKRLGSDLRKLGTDLLGYDKQLKDLTDASSKLAGTSSSLANNANDLTMSTRAYASVGQDIHDQLSLLNTTHQKIASEVEASQQKVVAEIGTATGNMNLAAKATESVADTLGQIAKKDIEMMAKQVSSAAERVADAAEALLQVKGSLLQANQQLQGSVSHVDQQLQGSLSQVNQQLQATTEELKNAAQSLADIVARRQKQQATQTPNPQQPKSLWKKVLRRP